MPEKTLSEIDRSLRETYEKGLVAIDRNNLDYALNLFEQVLAKEPAFFDGRQALRAAQFKRAGSGGGFFKKMLGTASASPLLAKAQLAARNTPLEAIRIVEQILNQDPNQHSAHKIMAEAALAVGFLRTAVLSLEIVHKQNPKDKQSALLLIRSMLRIGQGPRAQGIMDELARQYPGDPEVVQAQKDLAANRTLQEGGYEDLAGGEGSYRDVLRDERQAVTLEQEHRQVKGDGVADKLMEEYEERLAAEPRNVRLLRALGDLSAERKAFDRAQEYYRRIIELEGKADPSLEKVIADTRVRQLELEMEGLDAEIPDQAERLKQLQEERMSFQLSECMARAQRYPSDLQIRFELGQLYFQAGRISEAIQEFQKAQSNPHRRIQSLGYLGQCFARRGMHDMAARAFQNALKEKPVFDEEKKELLYLFGLTLEKLGRKDEGIEQFKLIYEVDIGYRDVGARVDAYYSGQESRGEGAGGV